MTPSLVGRLAPSPSGRLHLGHAHTFVLAWLHARSRGGQILLRMEDLDQSRCRSQWAEGIVNDLRWLGLDWDGPIVSQWQRLGALKSAANQLLEQGQAYPCVCKRADLEHSVAAPHAEGAESRYAGTCRNLFQTVQHAREQTGRVAALRLRVEPGLRGFVDGIAGLQSRDVSVEVGDFVIANKMQIPSYQLAVVVDDRFQGVTEVFRGRDLLASTARQLLVYEALGSVPPSYFHAPLVVDSSGHRLAKRRDDLSLAALRELGVCPQAIVSWVARSAGLQSRVARSARELLTSFSLRAIECSRVEAPTVAELMRSGA